MKKTKLSLCMVSCLLAVGTLAGCEKNVRSSRDGVLLTYTDEFGKSHKITADDILEKYYDDSTKYQAIYDTIYSVIVRNYFAVERKSGYLYDGAPAVALGEPQMKKINREAQDKVDNDKDTAKSNSKTNNTRYKKELEAIFKEKGVETEDELFDKYVKDLQKETFEDNFYTYCLEELKSANKGNPIELSTVEGVDNFTWSGYINDKLPYHVSHVMVELADSSDTNYFNGSISDKNAHKLYKVINKLSDPSLSFNQIAVDESDDTGSGAESGDLGIMDYDADFINEFKLGIYAYEQFYKGTNVDAKINMDLDGEGTYNDIVEETFDLDPGDIPTVNYSVFKELDEYAEKEKDNEGNQVIEGATLVMPRNIIYNKYLNNHSVYFIEKTGDDLAADLANPETARYRKFGDTDHYVLHAEINGDYKPVIAVRGSSQSKQEIHFIVVDRSPFEGTGATLPLKTVNGVTLSEYYTTFYPGEAGYPKDGSKYKKTYVNFLNNNEQKNKERAEKVASKLKGFNTAKIGKYMFLKYMNEEKIKFDNNSKLAKALMKWINMSVLEKDEESSETWTKTVNEYLDKLSRQKSERSKLVVEEGKYLFKFGNESDNAYKCLTGSGEWTKAGAALTQALVDAGICEDLVAAKIYTGETASNPDKSVPVKDWFKEKGGLLNDGTKHA